MKKVKMSYKNDKKRNKGFTLIELLAVIVILAVLLLIAVPSVSTYISNSRKSAYITSAKEHITGARYLINSGKLQTYNTDVTYYIPGHCVVMENESVSPYGEWKSRYIGVTYNGSGFDYYWTSTDESLVGIQLTNSDDLNEDLIETGISDVFPNKLIGDTHKILLLGDNCLPGEWIDKSAGSSGETGGEPGGNQGGSQGGIPDVEDPSNGTEKVDKNSFKNDVFSVSMEEGQCFENGNNRICNIGIHFSNTGNTTITKWYASFTLPAGSSLYSNSIGYFANLTLDGNKIIITSREEDWNFLKGGVPKDIPDAIQISMPKDADFELKNANLQFGLINDDNQEGSSSGGISGDASDMNKQLNEIKVRLIRTNYWGSGGTYSAIYSVEITNTSDVDINTWQFTLELPKEITKIDAWSVKAEGSGSTYVIKPFNDTPLKKGESVKIENAFQFTMTNVNAVPEIK